MCGASQLEANQKELEEVSKKVTAERDALQQENDELKRKLAELQAELDKLRAERDAILKELADLKKHEATQDTAKVQATASPDAALNEERLRMYEKLNETEKAKADAIAEAYKMAMQSQQTNVSTMIGGLAQAATPPQPASPQPVRSAVAKPQAGPPTLTVWHMSLNGTQSPAMTFEQVQEAIQSGQVVPATMVWKTGMKEWSTADQLPELADSFGPPPMPPGPPGPPPA